MTNTRDSSDVARFSGGISSSSLVVFGRPSDHGVDVTRVRLESHRLGGIVRGPNGRRIVVLADDVFESHVAAAVRHLLTVHEGEAGNGSAGFCRLPFCRAFAWFRTVP